MKFLLIRFSSIGDVAQFLSVPSKIKEHYPDAEIHILSKESMKALFEHHPHVDKLWTFKDKSSLKDLWMIKNSLNTESFTHIYDAHNNLRSNIIYLFTKADHKIQRRMKRYQRFLLLYFKKNTFQMPLSGQRDFLEPLKAWAINANLPHPPQLVLDHNTLQDAEDIAVQHCIPEHYITFAPSAAHTFKRWPVNYWFQLINSLPQYHFVCLAGPTDTFTSTFTPLKNVTVLAGKTSLIQSAAIIKKSHLLISNDTGLLHFAEQMGKPAIALMGAAPFGFPSRPTTTILKTDLSCWPCSKHGQGPCTNTVFHECMMSIDPKTIHNLVNQKMMEMAAAQ